MHQTFCALNFSSVPVIAIAELTFKNGAKLPRNLI